MRDYVFRYSLRVRPVNSSMRQTDSGWPHTKAGGGRYRPAALRGTPTDAKLAQWVDDYHASLLPGGANEHLGQNGRLASAEIIDIENDSAVVARWSLV